MIVMSPTDRLLTTGEAAKVIGLSRRTLSKYAREGRLHPALTMPGTRPTYWWDEDDLREQVRKLGGRG